MKYWLSIVRFVPDAGRGEFINVGAIAGSDETDEWEVRAVSNWKRARQLGGGGQRHVLVGAVTDFLSDLQAAVEPEPETEGDGLSLQVLRRMSEEMRNVVQVTEPMPVVVDSPRAALDLAFREIILDPNSLKFPFEKKHRAVAAIKEAYEAVDLAPYRKAVVWCGPYQSPLDFTIANGSAVQLVRCWSFQLPDQLELAEQVKAWAWTVRALREGNGGKVVFGEAQGEEPRVLPVKANVDVEAVFVPPAAAQRDQAAWQVAQAAFADGTGVSLVPVQDAAQVANRARTLLGH